MESRSARPETDQCARSLLQKAVRRGHADLVDTVFEYLLARGDADWLRQRTGVILFEECWLLAGGIELPRRPEACLDLLLAVAQAEKSKEAAGLGGLAYASERGEQIVPSLPPGLQRELRIVVEAIRRPERFFAWAQAEVASPEQLRLIANARTAFGRGGWPWDRAFVIAAAYLATRGMPSRQIDGIERIPLSTWVAVDMHTPVGRACLKEIAHARGLAYPQLKAAAFFSESVVTTQARASTWWELECRLSLAAVGLSIAGAANLWFQVRDEFASRVGHEASMLDARLAAFVARERSTRMSVDQLNMFEERGQEPKQ